jgi:hypothetical protein
MSQVRLAGNGGSKIAHNRRIVLRMLTSETGSDWWLQFQGLSKPLRVHVRRILGKTRPAKLRANLLVEELETAREI